MSALPALTSPLLERLPGVRHAFFTRQGGVSQGIYASLNVGLGSQDDPTAVVENRARAAAHFGQPPEALLTCFQTHSAVVWHGHSPWRRPEGDGVAAGEPGMVCGALSADCAPVLLADAEAGVVCAAHAGWKGALAGVVEAAVETMIQAGAARARIVAAVGPCIGPASYEVGLEFLQRFEAEDPGSGRFFSAGGEPTRRLFDLPAYVLDRLGRARIGEAEWIGRDTYAEETLFFSNRRALHRNEPDYGRLLSAIARA